MDDWANGEMQLRNKSAIITGAASGIGRASAMLFAMEGAKVSIVDIDEDKGTSVESEIRRAGGKAQFIRGDVSVSRDVKDIVKRHLRRFKTLDILYNNAAVGGMGTVLTTSEEDWDRTLDVNLKAIYLLSREAIPWLSKQRGVIINTASGWGVRPERNFVAYCASKAGVIGLSKCMAIDHADIGIRVNCICPGPIKTPMQDAANGPEVQRKRAMRIPLKRFGEPEDIARAALFLASEKSSYMTASVVFVDGGQLIQS